MIQWEKKKKKNKRERAREEKVKFLSAVKKTNFKTFNFLIFEKSAKQLNGRKEEITNE